MTENSATCTWYRLILQSSL